MALKEKLASTVARSTFFQLHLAPYLNKYLFKFCQLSHTDIYYCTSRLDCCSTLYRVIFEDILAGSVGTKYGTETSV